MTQYFTGALREQKQQQEQTRARFDTRTFQKTCALGYVSMDYVTK